VLANVMEAAPHIATARHMIIGLPSA